MSNSPLVTYTRLSPNRTKPRNHVIDTITIHHTAGVGSAKTIGKVFASLSRGASANYGVGNDGSIGLYVDEADRAWTSSSRVNDHRAITIEVSNSAVSEDWPVSDKAYLALLDLLTDICHRNGIKKLVWSNTPADRIGHKNGCNMTVHRDFASTNCPGPYLIKRMSQIASEVNRRLGEGEKPAESTQKPKGEAAFQPYTVRVTATDLHIRKGPGTGYPSVGYIKPGSYTIVEEKDGWGRLKSGAGWITLDFLKKV